MNSEHKKRNVAIDLIRVIGFGLLIASVVRELRLPKQRRQGGEFPLPRSRLRKA